ncbi:YPL229W [Saccharomyces arboricola H-6]|uniref:YPL229W n=1 Tax=Saccharomyces arboricola (strain H-6 / AS 2.3317 / CBS 10644) TaxID=1160507 RepID=J8PVT4_SACAR|nr:YPL229W [Saccharomyces arboricola H-6]
MMPYNTPPNIQEPMNFASNNSFGIMPDTLSFQNFKYDHLQQQQQQQPQRAPPLQRPQQQQPISPPLFLAGASANSNLNTNAGTNNVPPLQFGGSPQNYTIPDIDHSSIIYKNNICKSFKDDLFFCPRSLLSVEEQQACEKMDRLTAEQMSLHHQNTHSSSNPGSLSSSPPTSASSIFNARPKFNPYTSQSFNPLESVQE